MMKTCFLRGTVPHPFPSHIHMFPNAFFKAYNSGKLQYKSECRMEAIFLESLFVEQIGAVVDRTIPRPHYPRRRCFAIFLQHLQYFHNIFTTWCKSHAGSSISRSPAPPPFVVLPRKKELHLTFNISLQCSFYFQPSLILYCNVHQEKSHVSKIYI